MTEFVHQIGHMSVLQQRLLFAEARYSHPAYLVENFPEWPARAFEDATLLQSRLSAKQYLPSRGSDELIAQIIAHERQKYGVALPAESILVTSGGMHALWLAFRAIANRKPGGTVLCLGTTFIGVVNLIAMAGMKVRFIQRSPAEISVEDVERQLTPEVSCLYINSPHNPTGEYIDRHKMRRLQQLVRARSISCVLDAVYDSYFFDGTAPEMPADMGFADHLYFVCSMSKNFGLPGARIGWLVSSPENIRTAIFWLENENVSVSSVSQGLAARVLAFGNRPLMESMIKVRACVLSFLDRAFGLRRIPPAGTQMALRLPVEDIEHFADYALNRHELVLATSSNYAGFEHGFIRLPFSYLLARTESALRRLELALETYERRYPNVRAQRRHDAL